MLDGILQVGPILGEQAAALLAQPKRKHEVIAGGDFFVQRSFLAAGKEAERCTRGQGAELASRDHNSLGLLGDLEGRGLFAGRERQQIVVLKAGDLDLGEIAHGQLARDVNATVDIGRIGVAAGDSDFFDEDFDRVAHATLADLGGDGLLKPHQTVPTGLFGFGGNLVLHLGATRAFLLRIPENAEAFEFGFADKRLEFGDIGFGLARKADNEGGADGDAGDAGADALDEIADVVAAGLALHGAEHVVGDVLQGNVDVAGDFRALGDGLDELVAPMRGVGVEQANPEVALDGVELAQERRQCGAAAGVHGRARIGTLLPRIHAEEGRVLGNQIEFFHAFFDELARLGDDAFDGATAMAAPDLRDDAERAGMVAALGDLDVGGVFRSEPKTRGVEVRDVGRTGRDEIFRDVFGGAFLGEQPFDDGRDFGDLVEADKGVDLVVEGRGQVLGKPLGHAAGDDEFLLFATLLHAAVLVDLQNVADGFLF